MFKQSDHMLNLRRALLFFITVYLSYIIASTLLVTGPEKLIGIIVAVFVGIVALKVALSVPVINLIALIILLTPFPFFIHLGKDIGILTTVVIYAVFFVYVGKNFFNKKPAFPDKSLLIPIVCVFLFYLLSFINVEPEYFNRSVRKTTVLVSCIMFFYLIINNVKTEKMIGKIIDYIVIVGLIEALMVILQVFSKDVSLFLSIFSSSEARTLRMTSEGLRLAGTFGFDYEATSTFFSLCILIQLFWIRTLKTARKKKLYLICAAITFIGAIATGSRIGIVGLCGGITVTLFFGRKYFNVKRLLVLIGVLLLLFFITTAFLAQYNPKLANLYDRFTKRNVDISGRGKAYESALRFFKEHPWIGNGLQVAIKSKASTVNGRDFFIGERVHMPHSSYFYLLQSIGILGTSSFLFFFIGLFGNVFKALRRTSDPELKYKIIVLLGTYSAFLITQITQNYLRHTNLQQFIWIIFALLISASKVVENKRNEEALLIAKK